MSSYKTFRSSIILDVTYLASTAVSTVSRRHVSRQRLWTWCCCTDKKTKKLRYRRDSAGCRSDHSRSLKVIICCVYQRDI